MKGWRMVLAAVVLFSGVATARPARAAYLEDAGWGTLTVLTNIGYMPVKVTYSVLGAVTGGLAFVCTGGDLQTAETVWVMSMGGTYVITPRMLQGEEPIVFAGTPASDTAADTGDRPARESTREQDLANR